MIEPTHPHLSIVRQCALVSISRSAFYYEPTGETPLNLALMRLIDEQFLETPFYGARQMARHLRRRGYVVGRKRTGRLIELTPALIQLLIQHASPHLRPQLAVEHATGARVSSIIYGCRLCDLVLAPGHERLTFHRTKTGESVTSTLTGFAVRELKEYLKWRGKLDDREGALFVTHLKEPYADNQKAGGGQNKTAWKGMRSRAIRTLLDIAAKAATIELSNGNDDRAAEILAVARSQADLLGQVTQHWFRHNLATTLFANGADVRTVMDQAGWLDASSALIYAHDVPENRRRHVRNALDAGIEIGTPADTAETAAAGKSK